MVRKDWKGRPFILGDTSIYTVFEDDIPVEKTWNDVPLLEQSQINRLSQKYKHIYLEKIFIELYRLGNKINKLENKTSIDDKINHAIEIATRKAQKQISESVNYIVTTDPLFAISDEKGYFNSETQNIVIEQLTRDSILVLSDSVYDSDWFQSIDTSKIKEIRLYTQKNYPKLDNKVKIYREKHYLIDRSKGDFREIFVLGGEELYKEFYDKLTDLYISFIDRFEQHGVEYFTQIELHNFETVECSVIEDSKVSFNASHLRKYKARNLRWKDSKIRYDVNLERMKKLAK